MEKHRFAVRNPATSEQIAELEAADAHDVARAVSHARAAQALWAKVDFGDRAKLLYRYRDLLIDRQDEIAETVVAESGKPLAEVYGNELFYLYDAIGFWARNSARFLKPQRLWPHLLMTKRVVSRYAPLGVVGIISPWNFPLALTVGEAIPALMAGNAVLIKPSELTPLSPLLAVRLAEEAGFPSGLLQILVGFGATGESLIDHVDMVAFTGSVETGRKVARRAAERLIPVTLELGGKDPMIVLRDADLERAANACVWGALMNSGQVCTSVERVYVEEPVYEAFVAQVVAKVKALRQGPGREEVELGSMTSEAQLATVESQIRDAVEKGARILTGGRRRPGCSGLYYEPTVVVDVHHGMRLMLEETFGPVIPIMKVKDRDEAVRWANSSRYGLNSSVFAGDRRRAREVAERIEAGAVCVNDSMVNFIIPEAPMGGIKESGYGRRHGAEGIRRYCRQKTVVEDLLGLKSEFAWFPLTARKREFCRRALRLLYRSGWKNKLFYPRTCRRG